VRPCGLETMQKHQQKRRHSGVNSRTTHCSIWRRRRERAYSPARGN
jgi:hypothetical protein